MEAEWMTANEVGARWRCSEDAVFALFRSGKLKGFRLGTAKRSPIRLSRASVEEWERGEAGAEEEAGAPAARPARPTNAAKARKAPRTAMAPMYRFLGPPPQ